MIRTDAGLEGGATDRAKERGMSGDAHRCGRCGLVSDVAEGFARTLTRLGTARRLLCVLCQRRRAHAAGWWLAGVFAATPFILIVVTVLRAGRPDVLWREPGWLATATAGLYGAWAASILAAVPALVAAMFIIVVAHESGHAIAARLVGDEVSEVSVGLGPVLLTANVGGVRLVLRLLPIMGHTRTAATSGPGSRTRRLVVVAAGPAVHAAVVGATLATGAPVGFRRDLMWLGGITLALNLLPQRFGAAQPTDGLQLLLLLRGPSELDGVRPGVARALARATACHLDGRLEETGLWCERALQEDPDDTESATLLAAVLVESGRWGEGRRLTLDLLDTDLPAVRRAVTLNNLAWADLLLGDPDLAVEANAAAAAAYSSLPWEAAVQSTWGYALIEHGRVEDGLDLTGQALRSLRDARPRASVLAVQAIGCARRGRFEDAERALRQASRLAPSHVLTVRAAQELERCRRIATSELPPDPDEGAAPFRAPV